MSDPTGEIRPVWFAVVSGRGGDRWFYNGPFESEAKASEFGHLARRHFRVERQWLPIDQAERRLACPRVWARHPWAHEALLRLPRHQG